MKTRNQSMCITVRYAHGGDMKRIGEIEEEAFYEPWLPEVIRWSVSRKEATAVVAEWQGEVVGYAIYVLEGMGETACIRVHRLAVAEYARRCGIGGCLLDNMIGKLTLVRRTLVFPVRETNLDAQLWLREYGLRCAEISEGYYADEENAYVFELDFAEAIRI